MASAPVRQVIVTKTSSERFGLWIGPSNNLGHATIESLDPSGKIASTGQVNQHNLILAVNDKTLPANATKSEVARFFRATVEASETTNRIKLQVIGNTSSRPRDAHQPTAIATGQPVPTTVPSTVQNLEIVTNVTNVTNNTVIVNNGGGGGICVATARLRASLLSLRGSVATVLAPPPSRSYPRASIAAATP